MDLEKQVIFITAGKTASSAGDSSIREEVSLFEAVRKWLDEEGIAVAIDDGGAPLTSDQIQQIAHSEVFKDRLLAFDERRGS